MDTEAKVAIKIEYNTTSNAQSCALSLTIGPIIAGLIESFGLNIREREREKERAGKTIKCILYVLDMREWERKSSSMTLTLTHIHTHFKCFNWQDKFHKHAHLISVCC